MIIGNEEITIMLVLHLHKILQRAKVISQMKASGGADATYNYFHDLNPSLFQAAKVTKNIPCS